MKALADSQQRSRRIRRAFPAALAVAVALALGLMAYRAADGTSSIAANAKTSATTATSTKIRIRIRIRTRTRTLTATVARNATARDFVSLLPLTLRMSDLFGREKAGPLPRALARGGRPRHTYSVGDIIYWSPGPDVAVYYRRGGSAIPDPGIVLLAKLDSGARAFNAPGTVRVRFERVR
jgi:hypothetical protein